MKHKYGFPLLTFIAGILTGVIGVFIYQVFGKATEPTDDYPYEYEQYEGLGCEQIVKAIYSIGRKISLDDTQPVRV